jgi:UDP-MurNAc hydroxylase
VRTWRHSCQLHPYVFNAKAPFEAVVKITFINHASIFLQSRATSLWTDPWTKGKIVNNCATLLSPSAPVPYDRVEHIWLSHEHSDHFHFPSLKEIPETNRRRMTFLHQKHSSPRVVDAVRKLGFENIRELPQYRWVRLKPDFEVLCGCVGTMDSFLAVRTEGECILNLNDCVCTDAQIRYIHRLVGQPSVLFTQFSIAQWIGNNADETDAVQQKVRELKHRVLTLKPEFTVPFASFAYACNQENSWLNQFMITPTQVMQMNLPGVNFMYPGDVWNSQDRKFATEAAVVRYNKDLEKLQIDPTPPPVDEATIQVAVTKLLAALGKRFKRLVLARIEPFEIYTHDTNRIFSIYPIEGRCDVREGTPETAARARYVMCSQVAWYTFAHTWGWNVLEGNATFLDRQFREKGPSELWSRCVNELSTDVLRFDTPSRFFRTLGFLWGKKFEILYRFLGKPITDEMIRSLSSRSSTYIGALRSDDYRDA